MLRTGPGHAGAASLADAEEGTPHIRLLGPGDIEEVERHLLSLDPADRYARFHSGMSDWTIAAYARRLDPARAVLVGALDRAAGRLLGLAEAHPADAPGTVEMAVTVDPSCRGRGLGQRLVATALARAFADGAETAEFLFTRSNAALASLAAALGARVDVLQGYAAVSRAAWAGAGRDAA